MIAVGLVLTDGQVSIILAIISFLGIILVPLITGKVQQQKEKDAHAREEDDESERDQAAVSIAKITDEGETRKLLWSEVRDLRKDYNQLSLAYAELQRAHAESLGEVRFMKLQIGTMEKEIQRMQSLLSNNQRSLHDALLKLEQTQHERDALLERVATLEYDNKNKAARISELEAELNTLGR